MTAQEFYNIVNENAPGYDEMIAAGLGDSLSQEFVIELNFEKKANQKFSGKPVEDLLMNYELENFGFAGLNFDISETVVYPDHCQVVAEYSDDAIVINHLNGKIQFMEADDIEPRTFYSCARDQFSFLDALAIVFVQYCNELKSKEDTFSYDDKCDIALKASIAAGGEDYLLFWQGLAGCYNGWDGEI